MPRVLLVFEPPDGGVAEHVATLALALPGAGIQVAVAGPREAIIYPRLERAGVPHTRLPIARSLRPGPYLRGLFTLWRLGRDPGVDLIHVHSSKAGFIARLAAKAARKPVVYTPHCFPFIGPQPRKRKLLSTVAERALASLTDATVCVAEDEAREARAANVGRPERLAVIHNGSPRCDQEVAPDADLARWGEGRPLAACVTVLRPQKGVEFFVRAAPEILRRVPGARLAVVGDGDLRGPLEQLADSLGVAEALRFFDFHPPAARQLKAIDVFVLPSLWEAFPISILEALACGVPQVVTDVGGSAEAVADGQTGRIVAPGDPQALAEAVVGLLTDAGAREQMAAASRRKHVDHFTVERMIEATAALYHDVLAGRWPR